MFGRLGHRVIEVSGIVKSLILIRFANDQIQ